jgi:hypothetical protein
MHELIPIVIAFAGGYLCGLITKHELVEWVKHHGGKKK